MGRFVLLLIAAAVLGSIALTAGRPDLAAAGQERESQSAALARGVAASAHAAAVGDMVDPATRRFRAALTIPTDLRFGADRARVDDYHLEAGNTEAVVTVTGFAGGVAHQVTSRYRLALSDFPGPLWIAAPSRFRPRTASTNFCTEARGPPAGKCRMHSIPAAALPEK